LCVRNGSRLWKSQETISLQENDSGTEGSETVAGSDNVGGSTGVDSGLAGGGRGTGAGAGARGHTSGHGHGRLLQELSANVSFEYKKSRKRTVRVQGQLVTVMVVADLMV
jgi:hypothetical protein